MTPLFIHNAANCLPDTLPNAELKNILQAFYDSLPESERDSFVEEAQTETLYEKILSKTEGIISGMFSCGPDMFGNGGWVVVLFCRPTDRDRIVNDAIMALTAHFPEWKAQAERNDREMKRRAQQSKES